MTIVDIILLALIGALFIKGLFRGFVREVFGLIAIVLAVFTARSYSGIVAVKLAFITSNPVIAKAMAFFILLSVVSIVVNLIGFIVSKLLKLALLGAFDRAFGAVTGVLKGVFLGGLALFLLTTVGFVSAHTMQSSPVGRTCLGITVFSLRLSGVLDETGKLDGKTRRFMKLDQGEGGGPLPHIPESPPHRKPEKKALERDI